MLRRRSLGLIVVVVGLILANGLGGLPSFAQKQSVTHILAIAWSPDGQYIAIGYEGGRLEIWNTSTKTIVKSLTRHHDGVTTLAWHPDGIQLASADGEQLLIWDTNSGQLIQAIQYGYWIFAMAWNRDATKLFTFQDSYMKIWDATTNTFSLLQEQPSINVTDLQPDLANQIFVASTFDGTIEIRSTVDLSRLATAVDDYPLSSAISLGGQRIVSGTAQGTLRIWAIPDNLPRNGSLPDLLPIFTLRVGVTPLVYPTTYIWATAFGFSGNRVYSVSGSGEFAAWDANNGGLISSTQLSDAPITAAAFNQLGTQLAYGDANGTLHIVDVASQHMP